MKPYAYTEKFDINLRNLNTLMRRDNKMLRTHSRNTEMSSKTKDFIQKICYKKAASIDMTRHGFINDSKLHPVNLLMKPLKEKLETIIGKALERRNSPVAKRVKLNLPPVSVPAPIIPVSRSPRSPQCRRSPRTPANSPRPVSPQSLPKGRPILRVSAFSPPTSRMRRHPIRKVGIMSPPHSEINRSKKRVRLVLPIPERETKRNQKKPLKCKIR